MKKLSVFILVIIILIFNISFTFAAPFSFESKSYILIDKNSGQVLFESNADNKIYPASTTKVMTAIIALEIGKLDQVMTASNAAVDDIGQDGSNIGIMAGEKFTMHDLLKALLIRSANETANIIAENLCPTRQDFIDLMNKKAKELGATGTHFVNDCGIHDDNHYTTARDLATIARYAMSLKPFRDIVSQEYLTMPVTDKHPNWPEMATTNKLLFSKSQYYSRVIGVKTGYTAQAGNNLIGDAVNDNGMELISVVIGAAFGEREADSKQLLEYGFKNFSIQSVTKANLSLKNIKITDASDKNGLDLVTEKSLSIVLPNDKNEWNIKTTEYFQKSVSAPVSKGEVLGYVQYERNGLVLGKVNLIASRAISKSFFAKFRDAFKYVLFNKITLIIAIILLLFFFLRLVLKRVSRQINARRQEN